MSFPIDVLLQIIEHCSIETIAAVSMTCKSFHSALNSKLSITLADELSDRLFLITSYSCYEDSLQENDDSFWYGILVLPRENGASQGWTAITSKGLSGEFVMAIDNTDYQDPFPLRSNITIPIDAQGNIASGVRSAPFLKERLDESPVQEQLKHQAVKGAATAMTGSRKALLARYTSQTETFDLAWHAVCQNIRYVMLCEELMRDELSSDSQPVGLSTAQSRFQQIDIDEFGKFYDVVDFAHYCLRKIKSSYTHYDTVNEHSAMYAIFDQ